MGVDERLRAKMTMIMHQQSDSSLTASELRQKYQEDQQDMPPSPRCKGAGSTAAHRGRMSGAFEDARSQARQHHSIGGRQKLRIAQRRLRLGQGCALAS